MYDLVYKLQLLLYYTGCLIIFAVQMQAFKYLVIEFS